MLSDLTTLDLILCTGIVLLAYFVRGVASFGSALVAVPLLAFFLPLTVIVPVIGLLDYLGSLQHGIKHREAVAWRDLWPLVPFVFTGMLVALYLLTSVNQGLLLKVLASFVLAYAIWSLLAIKGLKGSRLWAAPFGFLGGLVDTAFGTGGPFFAIYMNLRQLGKTAFRATAGVVFAIDGAFRLVGYGLVGLFTWETAMFIAAALPLMIAGMWIGGHAHVGISDAVFRRLIALLLLGSGIALFVKA